MAIPKITPEDMEDVLEKCYDLALSGLPTSPSCEELASQYLKKYPDTDLAVKKMVDNQVAKCATSGFLTNLGGLITLPVAIPANISSVLYVQLRMIAAIAIMGGYDPTDDAVQTLVYLCLARMSIQGACKAAGIQMANKVATRAIIQKIPGELVKRINKAVGFRLVTKAGTTGIINLTKLVPVAGGVVGGSVDYATTKGIARRAYKTFILDQPE